MNQLDWTSSLIRKKIGTIENGCKSNLYLRLKLKMLIVEYSKRAFNSFKSTEVAIYLRVLDIQVKKELVFVAFMVSTLLRTHMWSILFTGFSIHNIHLRYCGKNINVSRGKGNFRTIHVNLDLMASS